MPTLWFVDICIVVIPMRHDHQALESDEFAKSSLEGRDSAVGVVPREKLNSNGYDLCALVSVL